MCINQDKRLTFLEKEADKKKKRIREQKLRLEIAQLDREISNLERSRRRVFAEVKANRYSDRPQKRRKHK